MQDLPTVVYNLPLRGGEIVILLLSVLVLVVCGRNPNFTEELGRALREFGNSIFKLTNVFDQAGFDAGQSLGGIHGKKAAEALTTDNQTVELYDPDVLHDSAQIGHRSRRANKSLKKAGVMKLLFIVLGFVLAVVASILCKRAF
jgi:hypothetical protein